MEKNHFTKHKVQFLTRPHTWSPANHNWDDYSVDSETLLSEISALEALRAAYRDHSNYLEADHQQPQQQGAQRQQHNMAGCFSYID